MLVADPVIEDAPPGTDPLDIRDSLDWFEPLLLVDRQKLREEVRAGRPPRDSRLGRLDGRH